MESKMEILNQLSEKIHDRKCHHTGSMLISDNVDGVSSDSIKKELLESKFFALARKHSKSQDTTADLVELANFVIDAPAPDAVGEDLVRRVDMQSPSRKVRLREPGVADETARGKSNMGKGSRSSYVTLHPEDELEAHESWDQNFLEDADWQVATEEAQAVSTALKEKTSKTIIDKLLAIPAGQLNTGGVFNSGTLALDTLIDMRQKMIENYVRPNTLLLAPAEMGKLLKDSDFKDSLRYGDFVNKSEGYIGAFMGMDVYESAQMATGKAIMMDKNYTMLFGVRRYQMMESYEEVQDGDKTYGVKISTRYQLQVGNGKYCLRTENA